MNALPAWSKTFDSWKSKRYFEPIGGRHRWRLRPPDADAIAERVAFFFDPRLESG
jgi:hypothetical protein